MCFWGYSAILFAKIGNPTGKMWIHPLFLDVAQFTDLTSTFSSLKCLDMLAVRQQRYKATSTAFSELTPKAESTMDLWDTDDGVDVTCISSQSSGMQFFFTSV
jgi:hypothetical protein